MHSLKKLLLLMFLVSPLYAQTVYLQGGNGVAGVRYSGYSAYGYPWTALAGSDRAAYLSVLNVSNITAWSGDGNNLTYTTTTNSLHVGDIIDVWKCADSTPGNTGIYAVTAATSTSVTISYGVSGSGSSTGCQVRQHTGLTTTGKWEIVNTVGSETFKLYTQDGLQTTTFSTHPVITGAPAFINFVVGPTAGVSSTTGTLPASNFVIHSTEEFDVKFTPDADTGQSYTYHYIVAANGGGSGFQGVVHASPGYRQVFKNRYVPIVGQVFGNVNQMINWTITEAPAGGDASLLYASYPQPVFSSGTVAGQYEVTGCPAVDASAGACDKVAIWVSPNDPPAANPNKAEQVPCDVDTVANPTVLEVGPNETYPDLLSMPQHFAAPFLVRLHNDGTAGNPTAFHNQLQINVPTSGVSDDRHPAFVLCGVPNPTTGELPWIDGENATATSWASGFVVGPYSLIAAMGGNVGATVNDGNVKPFNHILISGVGIRNVTTGYHFFNAAGTQQDWGSSSGVRPVGVQYYAVIGADIDNVATPFFDDCNAQAGWDKCSLDTYYEGNHLIRYGMNGDFLDHPFYLQAFRDSSLLNFEEGATIGSSGTTTYSDRGTRSVHEYNRFYPVSGQTATAAIMGGHSEIQDAYNYILPDEFWGYEGAPDCGTTYAIAPGCSGAYGGVDWWAAQVEEHNNSDIVVGNAYWNTNGGIKYMSIAGTHETTGIDNSAKGYYAYNTFASAPGAVDGLSLWEDQRWSNAPPSYDNIYTVAMWPRGYFQNNIVPWKDNTSCAYNCSTASVQGSVALSLGRNLFHAGQITIAANIQGVIGSAGGVYPYGINQEWKFQNRGNIVPIEQQVSGWTSGNNLTYSTYPIDPVTLVTEPTSNAVGNALPLTGELAFYPPRFNPPDASMSPFTLRADLTTIGATDPQGSPTPVSIAVTPNPINLHTGNSVSLTCTTTLSDSTTRSCFSPSCVSSNTSSANVSGLTVTATSTPGTGTISCTAESLTAPDDAFTVTTPSVSTPNTMFGMGRFFGTGTVSGGGGGPIASGCTLVKNEPQYGFNTIPGSQRNLMVYQTGCPTSTVSHLAMNGDTNTSVVTFTVPDASIYTPGKTVVVRGTPGYPYNEILEGAAMTVLTASGTTVTTEYDNAEFLLGSSDVSATLTQISHINWSTTAGSLSCTSNCIPLVEITTDSAPGNLTTTEPYSPYPVGGYHLTSTHQIQVTATAVDNPSSSITYTLNQASKTTQVIIPGAGYTQAYSGQTRQLWSIVSGNTNSNVTWAVVTQPSGGDASLSSTSKRNTLFTATVAGRYKVSATSIDDPSKSSYQIIDVSSTSTPSWSTAPPDKGGPQACFQSADMTGTEYDVGPSKTYTTINAAITAARAASWKQGSTIKVFNEDTTGSSPTTYAEYVQVAGFFTPDQPLNICGVPDSTGHLPVMTGENAHGPSWFSSGYLYGAGLFTLYPDGVGCFGGDPSGSCGPTHIRIAGIRIINVNPNYQFYEADGTTMGTWGGDGVDFRTGAYLTVEGTNCTNTSQCVGTYANQNSGYAGLSRSILWDEAYTTQNGINGNATSHPAYLQSLDGDVLDRVFIDTPTTGDQGSCIKMRGQFNILSNVNCGTGFSRGMDFIEAQDDSVYIDFVQALVDGGAYNSGGFDLNLQAARQESMFKDFVVGSVMRSSNNHYLMDHDDNQGNIGLNARNGQLFMWFDTMPEPGVVVDTHNQYNDNYFLNQKINIANSIMWNSSGNWAINDFTMTSYRVQTNVLNSATLNNKTPLWGIGFGAAGWNNNGQATTFGMDRPLETHISGNLTTDFITTTTTPYDANFYPQDGSAAINAATTVTGPMSDFDINYDAVTTPGVYKRRTEKTTAGGVGR